MSEVQLTPSEILLGAMAGAFRQVENLKKGRVPAHGADDQNDWQKNIEGCLGEMALAKHLKIYWSGKGKFRAPDVGIVDVRTTDGDRNRLIIHEEDPDDRKFWLVTGINGKYTVRGWCWGRDGKKEKFWADPTGKNRWAFFVPQAELELDDKKQESGPDYGS